MCDTDEEDWEDILEDEEWYQEATKRKHKGIRYGGKYKGRGKEKRRMP